MRSLVLSLALLGLGCDATSDLFVDLRTDYVPEQEVGRVETFLDGEPVDMATLAFTEDLIAGQRVAELSGVTHGSHDVQLRLFAPDGAELTRRSVRVTIEAPTSVTVLVTRDCAAVTCPAADPEASECVGGRCVTPECTPETPEACPPPGCSGDAECPNSADCNAGTCISGACFEAPVAGACGMEEWCQPGAGCTAFEPAPVDAGTDAGGDAGTDAGPPGVPLDGVTSFAVGQEHACAIRNGGEVWCWGNNLQGALARSDFDSHAAVQVPGITTATALAAGSGWSCAVLADSSVQCWGQNDEGQLGRDSTGEPRGTIGTVPGVTTSALYGGSDHVCAQDATMGTWLWGDNGSAQASLGAVAPTVPPTRFGDGAQSYTWALGGSHSCFFLASDPVRCWGQNTNGELGDGSLTDRTFPVDVAGVSSPNAIVATDGFEGADTGTTCALETDGDVWCWGSNDAGQLGVSGVAGRGGMAVQVPLAGVARIWSGARHFCARQTGGDTYCWGQNTWGQLGLGTTSAREGSPQRSTMLDGYAELGFGFGFGCGLLGDRVECWGHNGVGQLNGQRGAPDLSLVPLDVFEE